MDVDYRRGEDEAALATTLVKKQAAKRPLFGVFSKFFLTRSLIIADMLISKGETSRTYCSMISSAREKEKAGETGSSLIISKFDLRTHPPIPVDQQQTATPRHGQASNCVNSSESKRNNNTNKKNVNSEKQTRDHKTKKKEQETVPPAKT